MPVFFIHLVPSVPSPPRVSVVTVQTTSIELTWTQQSGDFVNNYTLSYNSSVRGCFDVPLKYNIIYLHWNVRMATIANLEENSACKIFLTSHNAAGKATVVTYASTSTASKRIPYHTCSLPTRKTVWSDLLLFICLKNICLNFLQNLMVVSQNGCGHENESFTTIACRVIALKKFCIISSIQLHVHAPCM